MELQDNLERCTYSDSIESLNEGETDDSLDPYPLTLEAVMEKKNVLVSMEVIYKMLKFTM